MCPVAERANPYMHSQSNYVRPPDRGRRPRGDHTRRVTGFSPSRASSPAHTSTVPGWAAFICRIRRRKFFSSAGGWTDRPPSGATVAAPAT